MLTKRMSLGVFREFCPDHLIHCLAEHQEEQIPAPCIGGLLTTMTGWDREDLANTVAAIGALLKGHAILDVEMLHRYAPPVPFPTPGALLCWVLDLDSVQSAVDMLRAHRYLGTPSTPSVGTQWNAVLVLGLYILSCSTDGLVARGALFTLLECVCCSPLEA